MPKHHASLDSCRSWPSRAISSVAWSQAAMRRSRPGRRGRSTPHSRSSQRSVAACQNVVTGRARSQELLSSVVTPESSQHASRHRAWLYARAVLTAAPVCTGGCRGARSASCLEVPHAGECWPARGTKLAAARTSCAPKRVWYQVTVQHALYSFWLFSVQGRNQVAIC